MGWSEERVHAWLNRRATKASSVRIGSQGHDAAVLRATGCRAVVCCDQTIEDVHFDASVSARAVGRKAAARALSDLAATAAKPRALLLSLAAPASTTERWIRAAISAVDELAREFGAELVGGDLACARGSRVLSVTAFGELAGRRRPPGRDRARAGDVVLVTGAMGGSRAGRHLTFEPRIAAGAWLHAHGASAMMDVSDGLALDLSRIAHASRVRVELLSVPVHADAQRAARTSGRSARYHALSDGEDHELIATMPRAVWRRHERAALRAFPDLRVVGRVRRGSGLWIAPGGDGALARWKGDGGFRHGV